MEVKPRTNVGSLARLEIAREKTRIRGKKLSSTISDLEQAAEQWQRQKKLEKKGLLGITKRSASR